MNSDYADLNHDHTIYDGDLGRLFYETGTVVFKQSTVYGRAVRVTENNIEELAGAFLAMAQELLWWHAKVRAIQVDEESRRVNDPDAAEECYQDEANALAAAVR